ncbi:MAG TPA: L,D-transpeptidase, partial [Bradyrhizobium sp.]|nr:L,D-transpeptidase [Bradyrhizobium sp.]
SKVISETSADKQIRRPTESAVSNKPDAATSDSEVKPLETTNDPSTKPEAVTREMFKPNEATISSAQMPKTEVQIRSEKPAETAKTSVPPAPVENDTSLKNDPKDDVAKAAASKLDSLALKHSGPIAVFVSRKDSKLYVRQNFSPLFDVPVMITADERPLGTHIFTAQVDSGDAKLLHWSVVSLPLKAADRRGEEEHSSRGRKSASLGSIATKPLPMPDSPTEALDRLNWPAEVMAKIYETVSAGGSIIVSDQGIAAGETGEGTDFIVPLR